MTADGVAPHASPPIHWSAQKNIKWKASIEGEGTSTPIVRDGRVYLVSALDTGIQADNPPVKDDRSMTQPPSTLFDFTVWCLDLDNGEVIGVHYHTTNGRPYRSIGKLLIDEEKITVEEMSMQKIREYLNNHPEEMDGVFNQT